MSPQPLSPFPLPRSLKVKHASNSGVLPYGDVAEEGSGILLALYPRLFPAFEGSCVLIEKFVKLLRSSVDMTVLRRRTNVDVRHSGVVPD